MDELGHTYIPKVLPGSSSHEISSPTVGYLMSHYLINKKKKLMCIHIYIFFSTLLPWRNLWNTSHSKAPMFPLWNYNKRRFIIAPLKGISTMLTEPFLNARFRSTQKRLLHESSNVFVEQDWNVIRLLQGKRGYLLPPLGKGRGEGRRGGKHFRPWLSLYRL